MYEIEVTDRFSATHALRMSDGTVEPLHGHDWRVSVRLESAELDPSGFVADFHDVALALRSILEPLHHGNLSSHEWFRARQPTAEVVAAVVFGRLSEFPSWGPKVIRVGVEEAPGCVAAYCRGASATA